MERLVVRRLLLGHLGVELGDVDANAARGDGLHLGRGVGLGHVLVGPDRVLVEVGLKDAQVLAELADLLPVAVDVQPSAGRARSS